MTPRELLRKISDFNCIDRFCGMFVGKVYEYLSDDTGRSQSELEDIEKWVDKEFRMLCGSELYYDQFSLKGYCGAEKGECGFRIEKDLVGVYFGDMINDYPSFANELFEATGVHDAEKLSKFIRKLDMTLSSQFDFNDPVTNGIYSVLSRHARWLFPEFINHDAGIEDDWKRDMFSIMLSSFDECSGEEAGTDPLAICNIQNPALDQWMRFLKLADVEETDRVKSADVITRFLGKCMSDDVDDTEFAMRSYEKNTPKEAIMSGSLKKYQYVLLQLCDSQYTGFSDRLTSAFHTGLLAPNYVAGMLEVKELLEEMERKYHFLSIERGENERENGKSRSSVAA